VIVRRMIFTATRTITTATRIILLENMGPVKR
jgi:hypothetical protein